MTRRDVQKRLLDVQMRLRRISASAIARSRLDVAWSAAKRSQIVLRPLVPSAFVGLFAWTLFQFHEGMLDIAKVDVESALSHLTDAPLLPIHSDVTTLTQHDPVTNAAIGTWLSDVGYALVYGEPKPGQWTQRGETLHLRPLQAHAGALDVSRALVSVAFRDNRIADIRVDGMAQQSLTLGPFELASRARTRSWNRLQVQQIGSDITLPMFLHALTSSYDGRDEAERRLALDDELAITYVGGPRAMARRAIKHAMADSSYEASHAAGFTHASARVAWTPWHSTIYTSIAESRITEVALASLTFGQWHGRRIQGVTAAAEHFFGRPLQRLPLEQLALLLTMVTATPDEDATRPWHAPDLFYQRRNNLLDVMARHQHITSTQAHDLKGRGLGLAEGPPPLPPAMDSFAVTLRNVIHSRDVPVDAPFISTMIDSRLQTTLGRALRALPQHVTGVEAVLYDWTKGTIVALQARTSNQPQLTTRTVITPLDRIPTLATLLTNDPSLQTSVANVLWSEARVSSRVNDVLHQLSPHALSAATPLEMAQLFGSLRGGLKLPLQVLSDERIPAATPEPWTLSTGGLALWLTGEITEAGASSWEAVSARTQGRWLVQLRGAYVLVMRHVNKNDAPSIDRAASHVMRTMVDNPPTASVLKTTTRTYLGPEGTRSSPLCSDAIEIRVPTGTSLPEPLPDTLACMGQRKGFNLPIRQLACRAVPPEPFRWFWWSWACDANEQAAE